MGNYLSVAVELVCGLGILFIILKLLGKTQFSQITPFDFISALILGELVGNAVYDRSQKPLTAILTCCLYSVNSARTMGNQDMSWRGNAGGTASFVRHTVLRLIYLKRMAPSLLRVTGIWQSFFPAHTSNSLKYGNFISHLYHSENKTELRNDKKQNG